ncbi:MAG: cupin domain-containing protein [Desulfobacter sp.]|nr:MAG: cupin domain-containing protein [Desulfobacter sp.]
MDALIEKYGLSPHPEGGYYREIYRSDLEIDSPAAEARRSAATHIYFMLTAGQFSRFHRVVHDELWHFYQGDPLTLIRFDGSTVTRETIGPGRAYMSVVPGGAWQAAESTGTYSLVGCTVAPGFDFKDFSFLSEAPGDLERLKTEAPYMERFI